MTMPELEPMNRTEALLAGEDLEPTNRLEYFLKEAGSGGGGGGSFVIQAVGEATLDNTTIVMQTNKTITDIQALYDPVTMAQTQPVFLCLPKVDDEEAPYYSYQGGQTFVMASTGGGGSYNVGNYNYWLDFDQQTGKVLLKAAWK